MAQLGAGEICAHRGTTPIRSLFLFIDEALEMRCEPEYGHTLFSCSYFGPHALYLLQLGSYC